jgi:hypothetical protein
MNDDTHSCTWVSYHVHLGLHLGLLLCTHLPLKPEHFSAFATQIIAKRYSTALVCSFDPIDGALNGTLMFWHIPPQDK